MITALISVSLLLVLWIVFARVLRSWRMSFEACVGGLAFTASTIWPVVLGSLLLGEHLALIGSPLSLASGVFGRTPLGALNFSLLQWFGVRLTSDVDLEQLADGPRGRWWSMHAPPRPTPVQWHLLRWVWPLTGWWSSYRWIARRGKVRA